METKLSWIKGLIWRLALVACVVILVWGTWLNARVVSLLDDFSWQIPAQVFARPLELYQGGPVSQVQLIRELNALGYQQGAPTPGRYQQKMVKSIYTPVVLFPDAKTAVKVSLALILTFGRWPGRWCVWSKTDRYAGAIRRSNFAGARANPTLLLQDWGG